MSNYTNEEGKPSVKWRGRSVHQLRALSNVLAKNIIAAEVANQNAIRASEDLRLEVSEFLGYEVTVHTRECSESPTLTCIRIIFDHVCLFCEEEIYE